MSKTKILHFRIHTPNLLKEIADCALPQKTGILKVPINEFRCRLWELAELGREINDPRLNLWLYDMALYEEGDPSSKDYNPNIPKILEGQINKIRNKKVLK